MNKYFGMMALQRLSQVSAEACPPPCANTTNKRQPFGHRREKKILRSVRRRNSARAVVEFDYSACAPRTPSSTEAKRTTVLRLTDVIPRQIVTCGNRIRCMPAGHEWCRVQTNWA